MSDRRQYTLINRDTRETVAAIIRQLPLGSRVEIKGRSRTDDQNRAIHGLIGQIMRQRPTHMGITMSKDAWKAIFMHALGREVAMLPSLDGKGFVPMGMHTSDLTVQEFTDLIEFILAWCAREGLHVTHFNDGQEPARAQEAAPVAA